MMGFEAPKLRFHSLHSRRVAHIGSKVRTNPPSFAKFRFFLVRFTSAPCLVITRRFCSSKKEIWSNATPTVNVCTISVRWASPRSRLRCDQRRPSFPALRAGRRRVVQKKVRSQTAFFILLDRSARSVSLLQVLQSTMKRTKESDMDGHAKLFSFGFS